MVATYACCFVYSNVYDRERREDPNDDNDEQDLNERRTRASHTC